ncbi:MAG TPA: hypothetical protein VE377_20950 [Candidatus Dormibacteraeota bacterium]|nr:hypothetical protein [Candidatus Dormibacteraeota bacterium]
MAKSSNWIQMEAAVTTAALTDASDDWKRATNWLNSLAMFEMLPALQNLSQENRTNFAAQADKILKALGWTGSADRIRWAVELVDQDSLPNWTPAGLPQDQLDDAQRFLSDTDGILRALVNQGRIQFVYPERRTLFEQALNHDRINGHIATFSPELEQLLIRLARHGFKILRTIDPGGVTSPHGTVVGDKLICRAVDVDTYFGQRFQYQEARTDLIDGVTRLLSDFPFGATYDVGFVRPVGGPNGFDTALDVFFPVPQARVAAAFSPDGSWGWGTMFAAVRPGIQAAAAGRVNYVYPDGADHIHVKAY